MINIEIKYFYGYHIKDRVYINIIDIVHILLYYSKMILIYSCYFSNAKPYLLYTVTMVTTYVNNNQYI